MIHPKIVKMLRINRMNEFAQISNLTDDESIIILEEYDNKDSIKTRKREIETLIEDYKKKIGDLTVEYHVLQSCVSPDGLD